MIGILFLVLVVGVATGHTVATLEFIGSVAMAVLMIYIVMLAVGFIRMFVEAITGRDK